MASRMLNLIITILIYFCALGVAGASGSIVIKNSKFADYMANSTGDSVAPWIGNPWRAPFETAGGWVWGYPSKYYPTPLGTTSAVLIHCEAECPADHVSTVSQQLNGFVYGKTYQLSFYAKGQFDAVGNVDGSDFYIGSAYNFKYFHHPPINISLGSQTSGPIEVPYAGHYMDGPWGLVKTSFKYLEQASSAVLTFIQSYQYWGDYTCMSCGFQLMITDVMLDEVASSPVLTVNEALGGNRVADSDQFTVQITQNSSTVVNATTNSTTTGSGATVTAGTGTTGLTTLVTGTSYTITEAASGTTKLPQYSSTLACTDATGASKALSLNTPFTLADNDAISCTLTNTPKAPTVRLTKALGTAGRINNADQFTVLVGQRLTTLASATTTGTGGVVNTGSTAWTSLVPGVSYSLSEVMTGTSVSSLGQYSAVLSCSNAWAGSPTSIPSAAPAAFTPTYGDVLDCTWTNKPAFASLTITQRAIVTAPATFNPPETFVYTGNNGWTSQSNSSIKVNTVTTGATQNLASLNVATTLTVAVPTVERGWRIASIQCTDQNAAVSKNPSPPALVASSTSNMVTIPANYVVNNAKLQCAVFASRQV